MDASSSTSRTRPAMRHRGTLSPAPGPVAPRPESVTARGRWSTLALPSTVPADLGTEAAPVRTRIVALAVLASALATCLFAIPLAAGVFEYLMQHERVHLVGHARDVAVDVAGDVQYGTPIDPEDVEDVGDEDEDLRVTVYDGDGDRIAGLGPDASADLVSLALDGDVESEIDDDVFVSAVPVTYSDEVIGAVAVARPSSTVLVHVVFIWAGMAGLAAAAVTVAWLVGRRQARRLA